jgi:cysteine synthase A
MHCYSELINRLSFVEKLLRKTPIIKLGGDHFELYAKLEFLNVVGSVKDRPAFCILRDAIRTGAVTPNTTVVESSSGNFACALATFCRLLDIEFIPVIDPLISPVYEAFLRAHCRTLIKVDTRDDTGGFLKTRLHAVRELLNSLPDSYWPNQYGNPVGMMAHYHLTAADICESLPDVKYVFIGVSSAGTIAGVSRRMKDFNPSVRIVAVDTEGSVIFGQKPSKRLIPGIGSSISPPLLKEALIDDLMIVSEQSTIAACHELLQKHGLFVGGSSGSVYSAIQAYFKQRSCVGRPKVLFLCCDRGMAYMHNIYDPKRGHSIELEERTYMRAL